MRAERGGIDPPAFRPPRGSSPVCHPWRHAPRRKAEGTIPSPAGPISLATSAEPDARFTFHECPRLESNQHTGFRRARSRPQARAGWEGAEALPGAGVPVATWAGTGWGLSPSARRAPPGSRTRTSSVPRKRAPQRHWKGMVSLRGVEPRHQPSEGQVRIRRQGDGGAPPRNRTSSPGFVVLGPDPRGRATCTQVLYQVSYPAPREPCRGLEPRFSCSRHVRESNPCLQLDKLACVPLHQHGMVSPEGLEPSNPGVRARCLDHFGV